MGASGMPALTAAALMRTRPEPASNVLSDIVIDHSMCLQCPPGPPAPAIAERGATAADDGGVEVDAGEPEVAPSVDGLYVGQNACARIGKQRKQVADHGVVV